MRTLFIASLILIGLAAPPVRAQKPDADLQTTVQGNSEFGFALYQRLAAKDGNLFLSPYSISTALAMTHAGARGNTADEMSATLRFKLDQDRLHSAFGRLIAQTYGEGKERPFQLTVANRLWGQKDYGFLDPFLKITRENYGAGLVEVDYVEQREKARRDINGWVDAQTKGKIKDLIAPGILTETTRLVLTNAIYFKAKWLFPFDEKKTRPSKFFLAKGEPIEKPLMHTVAAMPFMQNDELSMVQLPYEGNEVAMFVILPKKHDRLAAVEKKLSPAVLNDWMKAFETHTVDLKFPKFSFTSSFGLNDELKALGMKDAFDPDRANFKGMAETMPGQNLYISSVIHKAFVGVDEKSTEAAAATAVIINTRKSGAKLPPPAVFHADHPFTFLIRDQRTGSILFIGRLAE